MKKKKVVKNFIVQFKRPESGRRWERSWNTGADGKYTKESASRRAKLQEKSSMAALRYRAKEIK